MINSEIAIHKQKQLQERSGSTWGTSATQRNKTHENNCMWKEGRARENRVIFPASPHPKPALLSTQRELPSYKEFPSWGQGKQGEFPLLSRKETGAVSPGFHGTSLGCTPPWDKQSWNGNAKNESEQGYHYQPHRKQPQSPVTCSTEEPSCFHHQRKQWPYSCCRSSCPCRFQWVSIPQVSTLVDASHWTASHSTL